MDLYKILGLAIFFVSFSASAGDMSSAATSVQEESFSMSFAVGESVEMIEEAQKALGESSANWNKACYYIGNFLSDDKLGWFLTRFNIYSYSDIKTHELALNGRYNEFHDKMRKLVYGYSNEARTEKFSGIIDACMNSKQDQKEALIEKLKSLVALASEIDRIAQINSKD